MFSLILHHRDSTMQCRKFITSDFCLLRCDEFRSDDCDLLFDCGHRNADGRNQITAQSARRCWQHGGRRQRCGDCDSDIQTHCELARNALNVRDESVSRQHKYTLPFQSISCVVPTATNIKFMSLTRMAVQTAWHSTYLTFS